jgi:hypothetical protein
MIPRKVSQRLERLEERVIPASEPKVIHVQYVNSGGEVTGSHLVTIASHGPAPDRRGEATASRTKKWR